MLKLGGVLLTFWGPATPKRTKNRIKIDLPFFCPKTRVSAVPVRFFDFSGHKQGCGPYIYIYLHMEREKPKKDKEQRGPSLYTYI